MPLIEIRYPLNKLSYLARIKYKSSKKGHLLAIFMYSAACFRNIFY